MYHPEKTTYQWWLTVKKEYNSGVKSGTRKVYFSCAKNTDLLIYGDVLTPYFFHFYTIKLSMKNQSLLLTAILLIVAVVVLPLVTIYYDEPLTDQQFKLLKELTIGMLLVALACFVVGEISQNYSQTDKLWSITPFFYVAYAAHSGGWTPKLILMTILVGVWAFRLTYNFNRRGGYSWKFWTGEEDYRWSVLRKEPFLQGRFRFSLFNLFFICIYQHALILAFTLPIVIAVPTTGAIGVTEIFFSVLLLLLVYVEWKADEQQWIFQTNKHRKIRNKEVLNQEESQGFISSGLWAKVRHPNYAAEQSIWIVFYLIGAAGTGKWINWSMAGCVLLVLLFQGSANFSEGISSGKYPAYKDYIKRVPRFIPKFW
jgi:steroid 5-alpha reductase family enzyme